MKEPKNPNEDPGKMTNTQRIALGLPPLGSPASKSPTQRIQTGETQKFQTQRMATGNTQRMPAVDEPLAQSWASNPTGVYRPGQTQRMQAPQIQEKKRINKFQMGLILTIPTLVVVIVSFFILGSGKEEVIERNPEKFKEMIKSNPGGGGGNFTSTDASTAGGPSNAAPGVPATPQIQVMPDGMTFRKETYATKNIKVELPLHHVDQTQPEMPKEYEGFGGRPLEAPTEDGKPKIHDHKK